MLRLLSLTGALILIAAVMIGATREVGRTVNGPWDWANEYRCSPEPCWHGIYPGKTPITEAPSILQKDLGIKITDTSDQAICWTGPTSYRGGCAWIGGESKVTAINLELSSPTRLGDALITFGDPVGIAFSYMGTVGGVDPYPMFLCVYFSGGMVVRTGYSHPFMAGQLIQGQFIDLMAGQLTPDQFIDLIGYWSPEMQPEADAWRGFTWYTPSDKQCN
jgi:hypothetical protein